MRILLIRRRDGGVLRGESVISSLLETLYLQSIPGMAESIIEGMATPLSECLDSVGWDIK